MGLVTWIVVGLIAGWLAGMLVKGSGFGVIGDIVLGAVGAVIGGFLAGAIFGIPNAISGFNLTTLVVAVLGAVIVVAIVRALAGSRRMS